MLFQVDMGTKYNQLSVGDRDLIGIMKAGGKGIREIAKALKRSPSTISRELGRNWVPGGSHYLPSGAHEKAKKRLSWSRRRERLKNNFIRGYVADRLLLGWSPEIIAGRLSAEKPRFSISHETIYQWIYGYAPEYIKCLVRGHKKRYRRGYSRKHGKVLIPCRIAIDERPAYINERKEMGHWKSDSIISKQSKVAVHIITERTTRLSMLTKIENNSAIEVRKAIINCLLEMPQSAKRSFTYDNGSENVSHVMVNNYLSTKSYFCNPYRSWEKGTVENTIGLVRRFLPKKTDFAKVSDEQIKFVENWLNNRPRKCLAFKTPNEAFCKSVALTS